MGNYKRIHFNSLPSTQTYARDLLGCKEEVFVTADEQTEGAGTKGRSFSSTRGGVYMTWLNYPDGLTARSAFQVMAFAAVAVCEVLTEYGLSPKIKWANDVYVNDKKICGILIENLLQGGYLHASLTGIGLNVCNELPSELSEIATTMYEATGKFFSTEEVAMRLIEALRRPHTMAQYLAFVGYMGKETLLIEGERHVPCVPLRVDEEGGLLVETAEGVRRVVVGEVSLRVR